GGEKIGPRTNLAQIRQRARPVRVVQIQYRRLRMNVRRPETGRMKRVALDLGWPTLVALDEESGRHPADRHRGGVEQRPTRNDLFGLPDIRDDLFRRLAGAGRDAGKA